MGILDLMRRAVPGGIHHGHGKLAGDPLQSVKSFVDFLWGACFNSSLAFFEHSLGNVLVVFRKQAAEFIERLFSVSQQRFQLVVKYDSAAFSRCKTMPDSSGGL